MILTQAQLAGSASATIDYLSTGQNDNNIVTWFFEKKDLLQDALNVYASFQRGEIGYQTPPAPVIEPAPTYDVDTYDDLPF